MSSQNSNLLSSGNCPKCGGIEIYTNANAPDRGDRRQLAISSFKSILVNTYLCMACGYFEEVIPVEELRNEKTLEKIKSSWEKVHSPK